MKALVSFAQKLFSERREGEIPLILLFLIFFVWSWFNPFFPKSPNRNPNESARFYMTSAIVERGEFSINAELFRYGDTIDKSRVGEKFYNDKAPGQSLLAVPPVYLYKKTASLLGFKYDYALAIYFAKLFTLVLPGLILLILLYRLISEIVANKRFRWAIIVTYALGTLAYPFSALFFSHQLAAALLFFVFYLLYRGAEKQGGGKVLRYLAAGALGGMAVFTEYPSAVPLFFMGLWLIYRDRSARFLLFPLGATPFALLLMAYNYKLFGSPFSLGYSHLASSYSEVHSKGFMGITYPSLEAMKALLVSSYRGLFTLSPQLAVGAVGMFMTYKYRRDWAFILPPVVISLYLFHASFGYWEGGWTLGPRHLTPTVPFLTLGLAFAVRYVLERGKSSERLLLIVLMLFPIFVVSLCSYVFPYFPEMFDEPVAQLSAPLINERLLPDGIARRLGGGWFWGFIPWLIALIAASFFVVATVEEKSKEPKKNLYGAAFVLLACLLLVWGKFHLGAERNEEQEARLKMIVEDYYKTGK